MREPKNRAALTVKAVEPRRLPSGLAPAIPARTFRAVVADLERIGADLERTHNVARAAVSLARVSREIPFGLRQLEPAWAADLVQHGVIGPPVTSGGACRSSSGRAWPSSGCSRR